MFVTEEGHGTATGRHHPANLLQKVFARVEMLFFFVSLISLAAAQLSTGPRLCGAADRNLNVNFARSYNSANCDCPLRTGETVNPSLACSEMIGEVNDFDPLVFFLPLLLYSLGGVHEGL